MACRLLLLLTVCGTALAVGTRREENRQDDLRAVSIPWHYHGSWGRRDTEAKQRALTTSLASPGVLERDIQRRDPLPLRKRGWGDFWHGAKVGGLVAAAAVGRRDSDEDKRDFTTSLHSPGVLERRALATSLPSPGVLERRALATSLPSPGVLERRALATSLPSPGVLERRALATSLPSPGVLERRALATSLPSPGVLERRALATSLSSPGVLERRALATSLPSPGVLERDIEKRSPLENSSAEEMKKRDAYEDADRVFTTRNNFESANKEKRVETRMQKRIHWGHALAGGALGAGLVLG